ncbi:MAG: TIM barrel protein [Synergistaceae bacterium]|nr:TIM barrel protein [Synergistaceae bacterium]
MVKICINTCVLPRCRLETAKVYREVFGDNVYFEILPMFDMPNFESNLEANIDFFREMPVGFHEPVFCVEHSAPNGSPEYEQSMYHLMLTKKFADILHPIHMVYHLNNCAVTPETKDSMLATSLANLEEIRRIFSGVRIFVENVGTDVKGDRLLDQEEFTALCKEKEFDVLIDVGHANANSWDIRKLIHDLKSQIRAFHLHNNDGVHDLHNRLDNGTINFTELMPYIRSEVPEAELIIEYIRPEYHGEPLLEDIDKLCRMI